MEKYFIIGTILSFIFIASCSTSYDKDLDINYFYSKSHYKYISKIGINNGNGKYIEVSDKQKIQEILKVLESITLRKRKNQSDMLAAFHSVMMYEGNELKFGILTNPGTVVACPVIDDPNIPGKQTYYDSDRGINTYLDKVISETEQKKID